MKEKTALVAGATGLVGKELVNILLGAKEYKEVIIFVRRSLGLSHPKLKEKIIDFEHLSSQSLPHIDDVFCTLGTTIKKAGSQEAFKKVDYEYPLQLGQLAKEKNANYFIVTAMGANANSRIFYSKTKGQVEEALQQLNLPSLHIFHPSLLLGDRQEFRFGEKIAEKTFILLPFLFFGPFKKYKPILGTSVAISMYTAAQTNKFKTKIYESNEMQK